VAEVRSFAGVNELLVTGLFHLASQLTNPHKTSLRCGLHGGTLKGTKILCVSRLLGYVFRHRAVMQIDAEVLVNHFVFIFMVHGLGQRRDSGLSH
jgi:hypothetical protein